MIYSRRWMRCEFPCSERRFGLFADRGDLLIVNVG